MTTHTAAHKDHQQWQNENAMWRDDTQQWQKEHQAALQELTAAIKCHTDALNDHLGSIGQHETNVLESERIIADSERAGTPTTDKGHTEPHQQEARQQAQLREAHERIKRHHYSAMAKLAVVTKAMGACM